MGISVYVGDNINPKNTELRKFNFFPKLYTHKATNSEFKEIVVWVAWLFNYLQISYHSSVG